MTLMTKLYRNDYLSEDRDHVINLLQSTFDCLGFTCADIGQYHDIIPQCQEETIVALAGYEPKTDVKRESMVDLDILQIKILSRVQAYEPALDLYTNGKNSAVNPANLEYTSLAGIISDKERMSAGYWLWIFEKYHGTPFYSHNTVVSSLKGTGRYESMSHLQRSEFSFKTLQFQAMYIHAVAYFYESVNRCKDNDSSAGLQWDLGVAAVIGSIEGSQPSGAPLHDGMLLFNLANKRCGQFGTCNEDDGAEIISEFMDEFVRGRDAALDFKCDDVKNAASRLAHILHIPVLQAVLRYAIKNESIQADSDSKDLAEGETFAIAVLPLLAEYKESAQKTVEVNMIIKKGKKPVADGPQAVADAINSAISHFGVTCAHVGADPDVSVDVCAKNFGASRGFGFKSNVLFYICFGLLVIYLVLEFYFKCSSRCGLKRARHDVV